MNAFGKRLVCLALASVISLASGCIAVGNNTHNEHVQFAAVSPNAGGFDPARLEVLHETTRRFVDDKKHAGIITLILHDGKVVDFQSYGYRDIDKQYPMERDTICRMYSMSKIITCAATLILMEDGKFNLDDPIANYIPELKDMRVWTGGTADAPQTEPLKRPITMEFRDAPLRTVFDGTREQLGEHVGPRSRGVLGDVRNGQIVAAGKVDRFR